MPRLSTREPMRQPARRRMLPVPVQPASVPLPGLPMPVRTLVTMLVAILLLTPLLTGCATPEQRAEEARAEVHRMMVIYGPACTHLGYAAQTDAWRSCVLNLSTKYELQRYATSPGYGWGGGYWRPNGWWGPYW